MDRTPKPANGPLAAVEAVVTQCLAAGEFESASRAVAQYEAQRPEPRGIGVDWANYDPRDDVDALNAIFRVPSKASTEIRTAAALMYLFGVSKPYRRWLPREASGDALARKLIFHAYAVRQNANYDRARAMGLPVADSLYVRVEDEVGE